MPALPGELEPDKVSRSSFSCAAEERKKRQKSRLKVVESSTMAIRVALKKIAGRVPQVSAYKEGSEKRVIECGGAGFSCRGASLAV